MLSIRRRNSIALKTIFRNFLSRNVLRLSFERPKLSRRSSTGAACSDFASHSLFMQRRADTEQVPPLRGDVTPRWGLRPPGGGDCRPPVLRCSALRACAARRLDPPGGLAAPRRWRRPPQPTPVYTSGGFGVSGFNPSENGMALTPDRACGLSRRAALRRRALVGQAQSAQPMRGPSAHTFCLGVSFCPLCLPGVRVIFP